MGNNNSSSSVQVDPNPQWTREPRSLGGDDPRNRMRKGYNPPKKYLGHLAPSPQKVLPGVNPTKAAKKLKPTSNGRNLKQCGTISGRKLNEIELDPSSSRISSLDVADGTSWKGIRNETNIPGLVRQNGFSSPNVLEEDDRLRSSEPFPNPKPSRGHGRSFHDSEPELVQPPRSTGSGPAQQVPIPHNPASHIQESAAKKQIRSKKKKSAPPPPAVESKKSSFLHQHPKSPPPPLTQEITKLHQRMFKTKAEGRLSSSSLERRQQRRPHQSSSSRTDSRNNATPTPQPVERENGREGRQSTSMKPQPEPPRNISPDYPPPSPSYDKNPPVQSKPRAQKVMSPEAVPAQPHYIPYSSGINNRSDKSELNSNHPKKSFIHKGVENLDKGLKNIQEKKCFYFGMDREEVQPNLSHHRHLEVEKNIIPLVQSRDAPRQQSRPETYKEFVKDESLSDNASTSSEMDIVLRPTLPPKRQQLPKFSPSAAWNRIDLDSPNSSEEEALRFNLRSQAKGGGVLPGGTKDRVGEGDSGISGLDGDGGGSPEILPIPTVLPIPVTTNLPKGKCWTPEQDLDESSSEFEAEEEEGIHGNGDQLQSYLSSDRARLTTRRNFFNNSKSDTEGTKAEPIYARSTKAKGESLTAVGPILDRSSTGTPPPGNHPLEFKPSLNRIINYRRTLNKEVAGRGLDANWFLSRSEPNSLNLTHLMVGNEPGRRRESEEDEEEVGIRSENGYAPTNLNFETERNDESLNWKKSASLISLSHVVYLPSQHSSYDYDPTTTTARRNRRAKSVENLLNQNERQSSQYDKGRNQQPHHQSSHNQAQNNYKRKKFKFQSTLKVLERKRIEKELSREAEEKELERLREIEAMKRVEAEFQKKRRQREASQQEPPGGGIPTDNPPVVISVRQWEEEEGVQRPTAAQLHQDRSSASSTPCQYSNSSSTRSSNLSKVNLTQRQDPEGAAAVHDLRRELIIGAKKRNGISSASSDLTQELSEYRQETRQYCDYRSSPRLNNDASSKSRFRNKYADSTSSEIHSLIGRFPLLEKHRLRSNKSTVVYPEIVCDIPNKPFPYMVNFSRLSGSHTSLLIEERPPSGIGYTSGPSSVISDNYRRDWAHHHGKPSGSSIGNAGKSSSITSLHSTSVDNFRQGQIDLNDSSIDSPKIFHRVIGSRNSEIKEPRNISQTRIIVNESSNEKRGVSKLQPETILQPQSFINYKSKSYRPVIFNPTNNRP